MKKRNLIVVFAKDCVRKKEILVKLSDQKKVISDYFIAITCDFNQITNVIEKNREIIAGFILDFENEPASKVREFSHNDLILSKDISALFIPSNQFNICHTKLDVVPFVMENGIRVNDYQTLLNFIPIFISNLESC